MLEFAEPYIAPIRDWLLVLFRFSLRPARFNEKLFALDPGERIKSARAYVLKSFSFAAAVGILGYYLLPASVRDPGGAPSPQTLADWKIVAIILFSGFIILPAAWPFAPKAFVWKDAMALYAFALGTYVFTSALTVAAAGWSLSS